MDCLEPEERIEEENFEVYSKETATNKKKAVVKEEVQPLSVISASIGEITSKDIMIAASSNGEKNIVYFFVYIFLIFCIFVFNEWL
jgi:translation initiation factor IF-2